MTPSEEIDVIIKKTDDWRGKKLSQLRNIIKHADPGLVEEVKWKNPLNQKEFLCGLMMEFFVLVKLLRVQ